MKKKTELDKKGIMDKLPALEYEKKDQSEDSMFEQMSLAKSVLKLAEIDHDTEYGLCRSVADRLLENVPEPENLDIES